MSDYIYWIWLSLAGGSANPDYALLLEHFKDAKSIFDADISEYSKVEGLNKKFASRLCEKNLGPAREIYEFCESRSVRLLHCSEPDYPVKLKWIYAYPVLLYVYGELPNLNESLSVAVVGTRKYTDYGRIAAYKIGGGLAKAKTVVISGLAKGNDSIAQLGCIENGGKTIAVMGTGIDRIYPSEHRELAKRIAKSGAIITEYPPGVGPTKYNFPQRNRIISGLSDAVVLVEAPQRSGALITTRLATEQSRSVYAVPGDITSPTSAGPISLLKDGAKPVTNAGDIIEDFVCQYSYLNSVLEKTDFEVFVPKVTDTAFGAFTSGPIKRYSLSAARFFEAFGEKKTDDTKKSPKKGKDKKEKSVDTESVAEPAQPIRNEQTEIPEELDEIEKRIFLKIAKTDKINADDLADTETTVSDVMSAITKLEVMGLVRSLPGGFYTSLL